MNSRSSIGARRRSLIAALVAGVIAWALVQARGCSDGVLALFGVSSMDSLGGAIVDLEIPPAVPRAAVQEAAVSRIERMGLDPAVEPSASGLRLGVPGGEVAELEELFRAGGAIELRELVASSPALTAISARRADGREPEGGMLLGAAGADLRAELDALLVDCAQCRPPPGERFDYGTWSHYEEGRVPAVYQTRDEGALDERIIARAEVTYDDRGYPVVQCELTEAGSDAFYALTERLVDRQLAILVDGLVTSAPRVMQPIRGAVWISMGDGANADAEAQALARSLGGGGLPRDVVATVTAYPASAATALGVTRVVLALLVALLVLLVGLGLARTSLAYRPLEPPTGEGRAWGPLALRGAATLALLALPFVMRLVPVPGVPDDLGHDAEGEPWLSFGGLSLSTVFFAVMLVELVAAAVPALRARRHEGPRRRTPLLIAAAALAAGLYGLQLWGIVQLIAQVAPSGLGDELMFYDGQTSIPLVLVTLVAGLALQLGVARAISKLGLVQGLAALYVTDGLFATRWLVDYVAELQVVPLVALVSLLTAVALATTWLLRTTVAGSDGRRHRLPLGGGLGLQLAAFVGVALAIFQIVSPELHLAWAGLATPARVTIVAGSGLAFALLTTRPTPPARLTPAVIVTLVWLVAIVLLDDSGYLFAAPLAILVAGVSGFALDVRHEARARLPHPDLVAVWPFHDIARAESAAADLRARGIPVALRGYHFHALLRIFGAWAPTQLMVPKADVAAAHEALVSEPSRPVVEAAMRAL